MPETVNVKPAAVEPATGDAPSRNDRILHESMTKAEAEGTPKSLLAKLREWLDTVPHDAPYERLGAMAREAGWDWLLRQEDVQAGQNTITVSFAVLIGRVGMDAVEFQYVDRATFALPAVPGPVSVAARAQITPTIVYMLFGRLPPTVGARSAEKVVVDMDDDDVELPDGETPVDDDIEPMITGADVPAWEPGVGLPSIVASRVDGVPVFADLDEVQAASQDIIVAVTNEVNSALIKMTSADQVLSMWNQNKAAFDWLTDMATPEQRSAIVGAFSRRKGQIEAGYNDVAPRRRRVN